MDKFVIRTETWKKLTYTAALDKAQKELQPTRKKPLQEKQHQFTTALQCFETTNVGRRRLSIRDEKLLRIFTSQPDQPLVIPNEDSGLSSSSGSSLDNLPDSYPSITDENQPFVSVKTNHLRELSDYVSCTQNERSQQALLISETPPITLNREIITSANATPRSKNCDLEQQTPIKESITPAHKHYMVRIQHDLNSPSAGTRIRALRALQNPTNSPYTNFDVPHDEQSIITAEEREAIPPSVPTIQELMSNIVVYVEVRSGEDNRSEGVKKVISLLGARVNDKLLRDTTHVIFKDGLLSTYKKAKNWNIPVVSILWIEACKNRRMICDPSEFPISNIDRYENPELYEKMKRQRSMQPDSECNKRIRVKHGTPKDSTPKTATETPRKSYTNIGDNSGSKTQTNINQFFKKTVSNNEDKNITSTPTATRKISPLQKTVSMSNLYIDSPATKLLKRIDSNALTPTMSTLATVDEEIVKDSYDNRMKCRSVDTIKSSALIRKALSFNKFSNDIDGTAKPAAATARKRILQRRSSIQASVEGSSSECSLQRANTVTPCRTTRRRSSLATAANMMITSVISNESSPMCNQSKGNTSITQEENSGLISNVKQMVKTKKSPKSKRRSTYSHKPLDISPAKQAKKDQKSTPVKSRRTLYTPKKMDETVSQDMSWTKVKPDNKVLDEELFQFAVTPTTVTGSDTEASLDGNKKTLIEEHSSSSSVFSSTRQPNRRRTLFDVSMDIIQQRLHNINNSARRSMAVVNSSKLDSPIRQKDSAALVDVTITPTKHSPQFSKNSTDDVQKTTIENGTPKSPVKSVKKRKLYVPNETTPIPTPPTKQTTPHIKRRRTIVSPRLTEQNSQHKARRSVICKKVKIKSRSAANVTSPTSRSLKVLTQSEPAVLNQGKSTSKTKSTVELTTLDAEMPAQNHCGNQSCMVTEIAMQTDPMATIKAIASKVELQPNQTRSTKNVCFKSNRERLAKENSKNELDAMNALKETSFNDSDAKTAIGDSKISPAISQTPLPETPTTPSLSPEPPTTPSLPPEPPTTPSLSPKPPTSPTPTQGALSLSLTKPPSHQSIPAQKMVKLLAQEKSLLSPIPTKTLPKTNISQTATPNKIADTPNLSKGAQNINVVQKGKWPSIVCTNMHREQIKVIREAISKLGGFDLDHYVTNDTSHVVSFEPRRTLNLLRALIRGLWILEYKWVLDSMKAGEWLAEEEYELKDFSRAVEICRTERQAFGAMYKCELFTDLGAFYVSSRCGPISKENLKELIELCGGKIADQRKRAKYILGDPNKSSEDKIYVTPFWVLDSITQMQMMRIQKYTYVNTHKLNPPPNLPIVPPATQVPASPTPIVTNTALL